MLLDPTQNNCVIQIDTLNLGSFIVVNSGYAEARRESEAAKCKSDTSVTKAGQPATALLIGRNQPIRMQHGKRGRE